MAKTPTELGTMAEYAGMVQKLCSEKRSLELQYAWRGAEIVLGRELNEDELWEIAFQLLGNTVEGL